MSTVFGLFPHQPHSSKSEIEEETHVKRSQAGVQPLMKNAGPSLFNPPLTILNNPSPGPLAL
jgi:hypothetical protein